MTSNLATEGVLNGRTRPWVVCHMVASVDGRVVTDGWPLSPEERQQYELVHGTYGANAWICGRVTMQQHFAAGARSEAEIQNVHHGAPREDYIAPGAHTSFAIAVDPAGKLLWDSGEVSGDHVVTVLTELVSDEYLATLRERGVSYLLVGRDTVDVPLTVAKIGARLGVRTLMLEGGGAINGSFLRAGVVDEVSLLLAPVVDGRIGTPSVFDVAAEGVGPDRLVLESVERRLGDVIWLRYRVVRPGYASGVSNSAG